MVVATSYALGDIVWLRSFSTMKAAVAEVLGEWHDADGHEMVRVVLHTDYYNAWDTPDRPWIDAARAGAIIDAPSYRLERVKWS
jgi:hypothetical protein